MVTQSYLEATKPLMLFLANVTIMEHYSNCDETLMCFLAMLLWERDTGSLWEHTISIHLPLHLAVITSETRQRLTELSPHAVFKCVESQL